jgi:hypothetical protein
MGKNVNSYTLLVTKPEGRDYAEDVDVDEKLMFSLMFKKSDGRH